MAEAIIGMVNVMKPYWYFEYWYDRTTAPALSGAIPIPLGPVNPNIPVLANPPNVDMFAYDDAVRNGTAGYCPRLASMLPMPAIGSDVQIWMPTIPTGSRLYTYMYVPVWRIRTVRDTALFKKQGNFPRESFGAQDSHPVIGGDRYVLPAASQIDLIGKQELDVEGTWPGMFNVSASIYGGYLIPGHENAFQANPVGPDGNSLEFQQGILDPDLSGPNERLYVSPTFRPVWLKVMGNELAFLVYKIKYPEPADTTIDFLDWNFNYNPATGLCDIAAEDAFFSYYYGMGSAGGGGIEPILGSNTTTGLYVMSGITSG